MTSRGRAATAILYPGPVELQTVRRPGALAVALLCASACVRDADSPAPPASDPVPSLAGRALAARIERPEQLIGGPTAKGRLGDLLIANEHLRVIVGAAQHSEGYNLYGGTLLDADVARPVGAAGRSTFGEILLSRQLYVNAPDVVEVVADGRDGNAAVVEARGEEIEFPLLSAVLGDQLDALGPRLGVTVRYVLEPGAHHLRIEYVLHNQLETEVYTVLGLAGFIFGDGAQPFLEGSGFATPGEGQPADHFDAVAPDVSYLFALDRGPLRFITTYSGLIAAQMLDNVRIGPGRKHQLTAFLFVGDGNLSRTQAHHRALRGQRSTRVEGRLLDGAGAPVGGARVHALDATSATPRHVSVTYADDEGRYALELLEGRYALQAIAEGRIAEEAPVVSLASSSTSAAVRQLRVPAAGRLSWRARAEDGSALPARLTVLTDGQAPPMIPPRFGELVRPVGIVTEAHGFGGEVKLVPGRYRVTLARGPEYEVHEARIEVRAGETIPVEGVLRRSVRTDGWLSTDTHIHAQGSADSSDRYATVVRVMAAENLELPVSTEHEAVGDFAPHIAAEGLGAFLQGVVGTEVTTAVFGHFNAFPFQPDAARHGNGRVDWYRQEPAAVFTLMRANPMDPVVQVNHPRWGLRGGYFDAMGLDPATGRVIDPRYSDDFDAIEVLNTCDLAVAKQHGLPDWFSYLQRGEPKVATAGSDSHNAELGELGLPRVYVRMSTDDPAAASPLELRDALRAGRATVTCGPFLELSAGDVSISEVARLGPEQDSLRIRARVAAPTWMDVDRLEVIVAGRAVATATVAPEGVERFAGELTVPVPRGQDSWLILVASGDRPHPAHASRRPSFAFTNPIFLDGDGDGRWGRGGLRVAR
jgi:hypothetical protein